jgi:LysR family glycine cleavage system transcriptional activator
MQAAMTIQLPNLNALRAFEAAGRHLSFTRAAAELNVTQAAISQRVRQLEDQLGMRLFRRMNRQLALTEAAARYHGEIRALFHGLAGATERLKGRDPARLLTASVPPSFAAQFLVPRLGRFLARHPEIEVRLDVTAREVDLLRDGIDLAVRHGPGAWPGLAETRLMVEDWSPVCSPALLEGPHALRRPQDLRHHVLLRGPTVDWPTWLAAAGVSGIDTGGGPLYDESWMAIKASIEGHGVALARTALVADELAAGRLVRPFKLRLPVEYAYYILYPPLSAGEPKIRLFRDWLVAEAAAAGRRPEEPPRPRARTARPRAAARGRRGRSADQ